MRAAIEERKLRKNIQTNDAPGWKLSGLLALVDAVLAKQDHSNAMRGIHGSAIMTLMWHTFGRAIGACLSRKQQLSVSVSGEPFSRVARIKNSVVQGLSIYKAAKHWQHCFSHASGMLFVCSPEPSEFIFPLIPRLATAHLPGDTPSAPEDAFEFWDSLQESEGGPTPEPNRPRRRPNISKYINDGIQHATKEPRRRANSSRRHSAVARFDAARLHTPTQAFSSIRTTTREDQSVAKVLTGYDDPEFPVATPTLRNAQGPITCLDCTLLGAVMAELFKHVSCFSGSNSPMDVAPKALDCVTAALLTHLQEVMDARKRSAFF
ncbi:hypothetical protein PybrP1_011082 [[Pythium] brassicae (nom. inval.)]|nr:hypothetical protein PybrP1_011082 [[Pythium] brassicae (nom. inval.)]